MEEYMCIYIFSFVETSQRNWSFKNTSCAGFGRKQAGGLAQWNRYMNAWPLLLEKVEANMITRENHDWKSNKGTVAKRVVLDLNLVPMKSSLALGLAWLIILLLTVLDLEYLGKLERLVLQSNNLSTLPRSIGWDKHLIYCYIYSIMYDLCEVLRLFLHVFIITLEK